MSYGIFCFCRDALHLLVLSSSFTFTAFTFRFAASNPELSSLSLSLLSLFLLFFSIVARILYNDIL